MQSKQHKHTFYSEHWSVNSDQLAGLFMIGALILSLLWANSSFKPIYDQIHHLPVHLRIGEFVLDRPLATWVNDGLMAFFFLYITLEIRREIRHKHHSQRHSLLAPLAGAVGGMLLPALIYLAFNWNEAESARGWAIPTATDIVLVLGLLALLGQRVPTGLRLFFATLAIFDDLGAIAIIAFFYGDVPSLGPLALGVFGTSVLVLLGRRNVSHSWPYVIAGTFVWAAFQGSGVHPALAGVVVAAALPMKSADEGRRGFAYALEHRLRPWVLFGIVPLFAFLNAGVSLSGKVHATLLSPAFVGVALGLLVGKPLGVFGAVMLFVRLGLAHLPDGVTKRHLIAGAMLAGVGFTMSLFVNALSFSSAALIEAGKLGIVAGSILSATIGMTALYWWEKRCPSSPCITKRISRRSGWADDHDV